MATTTAAGHLTLERALLGLGGGGGGGSSFLSFWLLLVNVADVVFVVVVPLAVAVV